MDVILLRKNEFVWLLQTFCQTRLSAVDEFALFDYYVTTEIILSGSRITN